MEFKGFTQIYTGNGKGKTTAAIGLAIRAAGRGYKTFIAQFMKKGDYGETLFINEHLKGYITIEQFGLPRFHHSEKGVTEEETKAAMEGIEAVKIAVQSQEYNIVILDEINVLLYFNIIDSKHVIEIIENKPENVELILTGRNAPEEIQKKSDLVTEMKEIKHYFKKNITSRNGIEK